MRIDGWLRFVLWPGILGLSLFLLIGASVAVGGTEIDVRTVFGIILERMGIGGLSSGDPASEAIVMEIRFPRTLLAALVGASLAVAGAVYQAILRNPLADPYILGVSSGASLGAVLAILTGWGASWFGHWTLPVYAFVFACIALLFVLRLARAGSRTDTKTIVLSGVVVQAFFGALLTFAISLSHEQLQRIQFWLMGGGFSLRGWDHVEAIVPFFAVGLLVIGWHSRELNLFFLGERHAAHLGVSVGRMRVLLLVTASLVAGAAVSVSGTIGFVGLVVPHVMRMLFGPDHRLLLPVSALAGAMFLVGSDMLARVLLAPRELPVGVITAFVGAPFFGWLLRKSSASQGT
ncbi:iron complex transport system permease protein [Planifilum fulgidum]|uniref:Iron complex transport system permease protein n=1 Tax=Planifilum fulgidum TaxID=201973 RepID=A0A1I2L2H5_9BACL|nr:iron ABC transporter permease [Planifilum fulgidum]SFF71511.1 iron complex transport system permease protein [Planifilum fulgidum]